LGTGTAVAIDTEVIGFLFDSNEARVSLKWKSCRQTTIKKIAVFLNRDKPVPQVILLVSYQ
jgi:hypothetical protein